MARIDQVTSAWHALRLHLAFRKFCRENPLCQDEVGIVMQHGVGDHVLVAGLAAAIGRRHGARVVLAGRPGMRFVAELYPSVARYVELPAFCVGQEVGAPVVAPATWTYGHFRGMELARVVGYDTMGLLDAYRCLFGLDREAALERPRLPTEIERRQAADFLRARGYVPGRAVLISRMARSTPVADEARSLFPELERKLEERGYRTLDNDQRNDGSGGSCDIPLGMLRAVVLEAGGIAAVRNGLCDLLCDLPVPVVIFYADKHYLGGPLFRGTSVAGYGYTEHVGEFKIDALTGGGIRAVAQAAAKFPYRVTTLFSSETKLP